MSIRKKIIISFIILVIVPFLMYNLSIRWLADNPEGTQGLLVSNTDSVVVEYFYDSDILLHQIYEIVDTDPDLFYEEETIRSMFNGMVNDSLGIVVYEEDELIYYDDNVMYEDLMNKTVDLIKYDEATGLKSEVDYLKMFSYNFQFSNGNNGQVAILLSVNTILRKIVFIMVSTISIYSSIFILIAIFLVIWIVTSINRNIRVFEDASRNISEGDLDFEITIKGKNEFNSLAATFNTMASNLKAANLEREKLENDKREMIANISHDLRSPMTSIRGYVQGIQDGMAGDPEVFYEYLETIKLKTDMIELLIRDLNEIYSMDQKLVSFSYERINLKHFLTDCVEELSFDFKDSGATLNLRSVSEHIIVSIDPQKMRRVVVNILNNAQKYKGRNPLVVDIGVVNNRDEVTIYFADNGIGVDLQSLERIFDRFFRGDKSRNLDQPGSGIGLSICKEIVEEHEGRIWAESRPGSGTTINVSLKKG